MLSRVPQGSVLGPVLFVYGNDIPDCVDNLVGMYADDIKTFLKIKAKADNEKLQIDLSNLEEWAKTWQLGLNASKCNVMYFGRQNSCSQYIMNEDGQQLQVEESCCEKNVGLNIDTHCLKFNKQIKTAINKANSKLRIICRYFKILLAFYQIAYNNLLLHKTRLPIWCLDMLQDFHTFCTSRKQHSCQCGTWNNLFSKLALEHCISVLLYILSNLPWLFPLP